MSLVTVNKYKILFSKFFGGAAAYIIGQEKGIQILILKKAYFRKSDGINICKNVGSVFL